MGDGRGRVICKEDEYEEAEDEEDEDEEETGEEEVGEDGEDEDEAEEDDVMARRFEEGTVLDFSTSICE